MPMIPCVDCRQLFGPDKGRTLPRGFVCHDCYAEDVRKRQATWASERAGSSAVDPTALRALGAVLGVALFAAGLWFLFNPEIPDGDASSALLASVRGADLHVANIQRLAFGQAFTIAGAVFLAAALRGPAKP